MKNKVFIVTSDEVATYTSSYQKQLLDTLDALVVSNPEVGFTDLIAYARENYVLQSSSDAEPFAALASGVQSEVVEEPVVEEFVFEEPVAEGPIFEEPEVVEEPVAEVEEVVEELPLEEEVTPEEPINYDDMELPPPHNSGEEAFPVQPRPQQLDDEDEDDGELFYGSEEEKSIAFRNRKNQGLLREAGLLDKMN